MRPTALAMILFLSACARCSSRSEAVNERIPPYPDCVQPLEASTQLFAHTMRASERMRNREVLERYEAHDRGCKNSIRVRHSWRLGVTDIEVLYDKQWRPTRVFKRISLKNPQKEPGGSDFLLDTSVFDLDRAPVLMKQKGQDGNITTQTLHGKKPVAVIGPGRALIGAWVKQSELKQGEKARGTLLDLRSFAKSKAVALKRLEDRNHDELGPVQTYTIFGRDPIYTNAQGFVIADLAGMMPDALVKDQNAEWMPAPAKFDPAQIPSP